MLNVQTLAIQSFKNSTFSRRSKYLPFSTDTPVAHSIFHAKMSARELKRLSSAMLGGALGGGSRRNLPIKIRWTKNGEDSKKLRQLFEKGVINESTPCSEV